MSDELYNMPDWANWIAQSRHGPWFYCDIEPLPFGNFWVAPRGSKYEYFKHEMQNRYSRKALQNITKDKGHE